MTFEACFAGLASIDQISPHYQVIDPSHACCVWSRLLLKGVCLLSRPICATLNPSEKDHLENNWTSFTD